jgi:hypothetical protein
MVNNHQIILEQLRQIALKLNSPTTLNKFRNETDPIKRNAFNKARSEVALAINDIEQKIISDSLAKLKLNESGLKKGIENLDRKIQASNDIAEITAGIDKFLNLLLGLVFD